MTQTTETKSELFCSFNKNMAEFSRVATRKFKNAMRQGYFAVRKGAIDGMHIVNSLAAPQYQPVPVPVQGGKKTGPHLRQ